VNPQRGVTLVEVVAALALLAGTVTALLLAHGRSVRLMAESKVRSEVAVSAEELVFAWSIHDDDLRLTVEGAFVAPPNWVWRREAVPFNTGGDSKLYRARLTASDSTKEGIAAQPYVVEWLFKANDE